MVTISVSIDFCHSCCDEYREIMFEQFAARHDRALVDMVKSSFGGLVG